MTTPPRLDVLGVPRLSAGDVVLVPLERKLAAALSYLSLEGATSRSRLAGLLWPESPEATARNNLSQMLRKLRLAVGAELVAGSDSLDLLPGVEVDVIRLRQGFAQGRTGELLAQSGELLPGLSYDDCPDLDDWIAAERERVVEWRRLALRAEVARLAIEWVTRRLR